MLDAGAEGVTGVGPGAEGHLKVRCCVALATELLLTIRHLPLTSLSI